jgi:hypothetical protein
LPEKSISQVDVKNIPEELKALRQWVCWRYVERNGRLTKPPYQVNGRPAKSTDPKTWNSFKAVFAAYRADGFDGFGFVLTQDDPYTVYDLDHCISNGKLTPTAARIVERLNSYTEITPSGEGLRVIVKGKLPVAGRKKGDIEVYSAGRYITVTGNIWPGAPKGIRECQDAIDAVWQEFFTNPEPKKTPPPPVAPEERLDDRELLERARNSANGARFEALWRGNWQGAGYPSQSEADLALCSMLAFWTGKDAARIDSLFRRSGLMRPKWDEQHSSDGRTYGQVTIETAIAGTTETYSPHKERGTPRPAGVKGKPAETDQKIIPATISAEELMRKEFPDPVWVIPELLPEGLTILGGKPKMGKSWLALGIALGVACGGRVLGKIPVEQREVIYLALEDTPRRLKDRIGQLLQGHPAPAGLHLVTECPRVDKGGLVAIEALLVQKPQAKLIIVDVLKRLRPPQRGNQNLYDADYEILANLKAIADRRGVAMLVVHHLKKLAEDDPLDMLSGTTGLSGAADGVWILKRDRARADGVLFVTGRDIEEKELALERDPHVGGWCLLGNAEEYRISRERQEIIEALRQAEEPLRPKDIADFLGKKEANIRFLLTRLLQEGVIKKVGYGKYTISTHTTNSVYTVNTANSANGSEVLAVKRSVSAPPLTLLRPETCMNQGFLKSVSSVSGVSKEVENFPPMRGQVFEI